MAEINNGPRGFFSSYLRFLHQVVMPVLSNGAPSSGTSGTGVNKAGKGSLCVDYTNGQLYINTGTKASPTWTSIGGGALGSIPLTSAHLLVGNSSNIATDVAASGDATISNAGVITVGAIGGKKIARGVHQQAAATDTVATGLATVVAVVVSYRDTPTAKQNFVTASIGNQSGAPVAGSFLQSTFKSTFAAADDFTDNISFNWIAVGT
jgi:hypothetical protein